MCAVRAMRLLMLQRASRVRGDDINGRFYGEQKPARANSLKPTDPAHDAWLTAEPARAHVGVDVDGMRLCSTRGQTRRCVVGNIFHHRNKPLDARNDWPAASLRPAYHGRRAADVQPHEPARSRWPRQRNRSWPVLPEKWPALAVRPSEQMSPLLRYGLFCERQHGRSWF